MLIRTPSDFGAAIRDRRRQLGLDQASFAKSIGVSRQWLISVERGRRGAELGLVLRALDALGIGLNAEVGESGKRATRKTKAAVDIDAIVNSARKDRR